MNNKMFPNTSFTVARLWRLSFGNLRKFFGFWGYFQVKFCIHLCMCFLKSACCQGAYFYIYTFSGAAILMGKVKLCQDSKSSLSTDRKNVCCDTLPQEEIFVPYCQQ